MHPNENHFYLVSHASIQGVAKPTKVFYPQRIKDNIVISLLHLIIDTHIYCLFLQYCILLDEGKHTIDDLQGLSYNLCHLFTRCNRSVSYPAPTYYAHLAAYRGRVYIENENLNMNQLRREWEQRNNAVNKSIIQVHPMFFV